MPEIAEVARIVHYIRAHLAGKKITAITAHADEIVFGKVGCSASALESALAGKTILDAKQQGKYFWLEMSSPPHPLMHFGMTGWMRFSNDAGAHYRSNGKEKKEEEEWPPRFVKFLVQVEGGNEAAFVDARRLARIRLVDVEKGEMRRTSPLKENGPDPVLDGEVLTREWLGRRLRGKKVPVKAFLLDQGVISGVGNWVADEVLYQARIHPEQYTNTLPDAQVKSLHDSLINVCKTACDLLADSSKFPETWLMRYRWDKGKKDANKLPNGAKIVHLKVGGRTSAIVPSVQKKTGAVAGDVASADEEDEEVEQKPVKKRGAAKRSRAKKEESEEESEEVDEQSEEEKPKKGKKQKTGKKVEVKKEANGKVESGRRRSSRMK